MILSVLKWNQLILVVLLHKQQTKLFCKKCETLNAKLSLMSSSNVKVKSLRVSLVVLKEEPSLSTWVAPKLTSHLVNKFQVKCTNQETVSKVICQKFVKQHAVHKSSCLALMNDI